MGQEKNLVCLIRGHEQHAFYLCCRHCGQPLIFDRYGLKVLDFEKYRTQKLHEEKPL